MPKGKGRPFNKDRKKYSTSGGPPALSKEERSEIILDADDKKLKKRLPGTSGKSFNDHMTDAKRNKRQTQVTPGKWTSK